jgi:hypothetical protein
MSTKTPSSEKQVTEDDDITHVLKRADPKRLRAALGALLSHRTETVRTAARLAIRNSEPVKPWAVGHMQHIVLSAIIWAGLKINAAERAARAGGVPAETVGNVRTDRIDELVGWFEHVAKDARAAGRMRTDKLLPSTLASAIDVCARGSGRPTRGSVAGSKTTALLSVLSELRLASGGEEAVAKFIDRNLRPDPEDLADLEALFGGERVDIRRPKKRKAVSS